MKWKMRGVGPHRRWGTILAGCAGVLALWLHARPAAADLSPELRKALEESKYVYISSQRKDGSWSRPAEIWFLFHDGAVYVGTPASSWRAKRIRWGRPRARIAVGKEEGPTFFARGEIVKDRSVMERMLEVYAKKYADRWSQHEQRFRQGFADGSRVLIRYTPE
jgi:hypothetical protein